MLKYILFTGAIGGIVLAHGLVLYKIDTGLRSNNLTPFMASQSHTAFW